MYFEKVVRHVNCFEKTQTNQSNFKSLLPAQRKGDQA